MIIRRPGYDDIKQITDLISEFFKQDGVDFKFNRKQCEQFVRTSVDDKISFVADKDKKIIGIIAGQVMVPPGSDDKVFHELVWFVLPEYRRYSIKLFNSIIQFCRINDIKYMIFNHITNSVGEKVERFYQKKGFKLLEQHYIKTIS
jgi:GNAT superfamily N-acetyltransferase